MRYLVTGGCGFLGSNLSREVLSRGEELFLLDDLSRIGSDRNLEWLRGLGPLDFRRGDVRDPREVERAVRESKPDVVFHLAGQVAMTTSLEDPRRDFEVNALGSLNVLEAVRALRPGAIVAYSSTNKVYGSLGSCIWEELPTRYEARGFEDGFDETLALDFRSPYGCSKGAADQYMLDFARCYGLRTIVFRHSSIFGDRQFSTYDQGWIGWFIRQALLTREGRLERPFTISGDGKQVRDVLFASDLVRCYFMAAEAIGTTAGQAYNVGGGRSNSLSLLELFRFLEDELDVRLRFERLPWRRDDQKAFIADTRKAAADFRWSPLVDAFSGIRSSIGWIRDRELE